MGMTTRLGIDDVRPLISAGSVASKAVVGEVIPVTALVWREGHDAVSATLSAWAARTAATSSVTMHVDPDDQDRVHGVFTPGTQGTWYFRVDAWSDPIATWKNAVTKKMAAGQSAAELANDLQHGAELFSRAALQTPSDVVEPLFAAARDLEDESLDVDKRVQVALSEEVAGILHSHPLRDLLVEGAIHEVYVERRAALYNSWYELFPAPREAGIKREIQSTALLTPLPRHWSGWPIWASIRCTFRPSIPSARYIARERIIRSWPSPAM